MFIWSETNLLLIWSKTMITLDSHNDWLGNRIVAILKRRVTEAMQVNFLRWSERCKWWSSKVLTLWEASLSLTKTFDFVTFLLSKVPSIVWPSEVYHTLVAAAHAKNVKNQFFNNTFWKWGCNGGVYFLVSSPR